MASVLPRYSEPETTALPLLKRPIPLWALVLCAFVFHGPLLIMQLPANSYDANFHMSLASHYAHHWFNPWNEKSFAGWSQTSYPPLTHQWIAIFSHVIGLNYAYMLVQGIIILLLPIAVYRFAALWTPEREASYAAFFSIFLGSLCVLVYLDGQIGTTSSTTLFLLALPSFYRYVLEGKPWELILGVSIACTAAAAHHATLIFGMVFFIPPVVWLSLLDFKDRHPDRSILLPIRRIALFSASAAAGMFLVLLPYFLILMKHPINEVPIPHTSRVSYLLYPKWGLHYFVVPYGPVILALPYLLYKCAERRLLPLFLGFYGAFLFGLGGTTPVPRMLLRRAYEVLTFERFALWALILALPFVGMLAVRLIDRYGSKAAYLIAASFIGWASFAVAWNTYLQLRGDSPDVQPIINFLNEKGHDQYRYLTLGYGYVMSKITCYTEASSVDGEYNSARTLPELTRYGVAQLSTAKFYGVDGISALSDMLKHAPRYGLRYIFVRETYYDPLLTFAGWRPIEHLSDGETVVWTTIGIPRARKIPSPLEPPRWQGILWGIVPFGSSLVTILLAIVLREKNCSTWNNSQKAAHPVP